MSAVNFTLVEYWKTAGADPDFTWGVSGKRPLQAGACRGVRGHAPQGKVWSFNSSEMRFPEFLRGNLSCVIALTKGQNIYINRDHFLLLKLKLEIVVIYLYLLQAFALRNHAFSKLKQTVMLGRCWDQPTSKNARLSTSVILGQGFHRTTWTTPRSAPD